jgi:hypothetical protein
VAGVLAFALAPGRSEVQNLNRMEAPVSDDLIDDTAQETWEAQTDSTVFVFRYDKRTREYKLVRVGGPSGTRRVTITRADREYHQGMIPEENAGTDPFTNGRLRRVDAEGLPGAPTNAELKEYLELRDPEEFRLLVAEMDDELTMRRLLTLAAQDGSMWQVEILRDIVDERFRVGKGQKVVEEMMAGPTGIGDETTLVG